MHFITNDKFSVQAYLPDNSLNPNIPLYNTRMDWLPYGDLNDYPNLLTDLLMKSSIHKAIQYGKWELSQGGGLTWDDIDENDRASKIKMNKLFYSANSQETLNEVLIKLFLII